MTTLLDSLAEEVDVFTRTGDNSLQALQDTAASFLADLRQLESQLEDDISGAGISTSVQSAADSWYGQSISSLKAYNTATNKFYKNVLNNPKFNIDIDDAYTYKLNLDSIPSEYERTSTNGEEVAVQEVRRENQHELGKAIVLHLLKIGQSDIVRDMLQDSDTIRVDPALLDKFGLLHEIVDGIVVHHDLRKPLQWFQDRYNESVLRGQEVSFEAIEFKFHMLQFTLLLNENAEFALDNASRAYLYSKEHFSRFLRNYLHEISPLMTLLLFRTAEKSPSVADDYARKNMVELLQEFGAKMRTSFTRSHDGPRHRGESQFVEEILNSFETIHENQALFMSLSSEFTSHYCNSLNLADDSSLFQSVLAGYINLPSFYKYNRIQRKFSKVPAAAADDGKPDRPDVRPDNMIVAPFAYDMPFQLADAHRFLFDYHPIFICPVSKDQLIPLTVDDHSAKKNKRPKLDHHEELVRNMANPVVVLKYCQHVALKESIWQLSRRGAEVFKCHYCYKKHKINEVKDGYFIDL